ncbi:hypothetical protein [Pontiella sulfatireligans]|uniref:STAS domain-containing protein n=1 Tax=Pontiella sulfatireligans TaxID=2750658 RepID=A0A6C2UIG7_9BACT|nr:hypothetical protein [Pontiella sulfatireligans]VGO19918.1 hypothetical protein SCARR_01978 [Pontiella sulfatireligans]
MYLLEIDRTLNRIHITLSDRFDEPQAIALLDEIRLRMGELERDFLLLCDLTTLEEFSPSARSHFRAVMDLCNEAGVRKIIRIIPHPLDNFGLTIMSYIHYDSGIPVVTCKALKEVSKHLK